MPSPRDDFLDPNDGGISRRSFLKLSGLAAASITAAPLAKAIAGASLGPGATPVGRVEFLRPVDLAKGALEFENLGLETRGQGSTRFLAPINAARPSRIALILPPQHFLEESVPDSTHVQHDKSLEIYAAGPSRLVFVWGKDSFPKFEIRFFLEDILAALRRQPIQPPSAVACLGAEFQKAYDLNQSQALEMPGPMETGIEWPKRMIISPAGGTRFFHQARPRRTSRTIYDWVELWHTGLDLRPPEGSTVKHPAMDLGSTGPDGSYLRPPFPVLSLASPTANPLTNADLLLGPVSAEDDSRGVLYPVFRTEPHIPELKEPAEMEKSFKFPLKNRDLANILSQMAVGDGVTRSRQMILTSLGASCDVEYRSLLNADGGVRQWVQRSGLGRDNYVRIVTNGHLFPFMHQAVYVRIWERKLRNKSDGEPFGAYLCSRQFLIILEPEKWLPADDSSGVLEADQLARGLNFSYVRIKEAQTPDLSNGIKNTHPEDSSGNSPFHFWPEVNLMPFRFHCEARDRSGRSCDLTMQMYYAESLADGQKWYYRGTADERTAVCNSAPLAFVADPGVPFGPGNFDSHLISVFARICNDDEARNLLGIERDEGEKIATYLNAIPCRDMAANQAVVAAKLQKVFAPPELSDAGMVRRLRAGVQSLCSARADLDAIDSNLGKIASAAWLSKEDAENLRKLVQTAGMAVDKAQTADPAGIYDNVAATLASAMETRIRAEAGKAFVSANSVDIKTMTGQLADQIFGPGRTKGILETLPLAAAKWHEQRVKLFGLSASFLKGMDNHSDLLPDVLNLLSGFDPKAAEFKNNLDSLKAAVGHGAASQPLPSNPASYLKSNAGLLAARLCQQGGALRLRQILLVDQVHKQFKISVSDQLSGPQKAVKTLKEGIANVLTGFGSLDLKTIKSTIPAFADRLPGVVGLADLAKQCEDPSVSAEALAKSLKQQASDTLNRLQRWPQKEALNFLNATSQVLSANKDAVNLVTKQLEAVRASLANVTPGLAGQWNQLRIESRQELQGFLATLKGQLKDELIHCPWVNDLENQALDASNSIADLVKSLRQQATTTLQDYQNAGREAALALINATGSAMNSTGAEARALTSRLLASTLPGMVPDVSVQVSTIRYGQNQLSRIGVDSQHLLDWEKHLPCYEQAFVQVPSLNRMTQTAGDVIIAPLENYLDHGFFREGEDHAQGVLQGVYAQFESAVAGVGKDVPAGVMQPALQLAGLSRETGTVIGDVKDLATMAQLAAPARLPTIERIPVGNFLPDVKLLGSLDMKDILMAVADYSKLPQILSHEFPDRVESSWKWTADLNSAKLGFVSFEPQAARQFSMSARTVIRRGGAGGLDVPPPETMVLGELDPFKVILGNLISVTVKGLSFQTGSHLATRFTPGQIVVEFLGPLAFVAMLEEWLSSLLGVKGLDIKIGLSEVEVGLSLQLPDISSGAFSLSGIRLETALVLPLGPGTVSYKFSFCDRDNRFLLIIYGLAGSGYLTLQISTDGERSIEGALEFGGALAFSVAVAQGMIYAFGGIYFHIATRSQEVSGYFRVGGRVSILGIIDVSIEIMLALRYTNDGQTTVFAGRGSIEVRLKICFFKMTVKVEFEKQFAGSHSETHSSEVTYGRRPHALHDRFAGYEDEDDLAVMRTYWRHYCSAFAV